VLALASEESVEQPATVELSIVERIQLAIQEPSYEHIPVYVALAVSGVILATVIKALGVGVSIKTTEPESDGDPSKAMLEELDKFTYPKTPSGNMIQPEACCKLTQIINKHAYIQFTPIKE